MVEKYSSDEEEDSDENEEEEAAPMGSSASGGAKVTQSLQDFHSSTIYKSSNGFIGIILAIIGTALGIYLNTLWIVPVAILVGLIIIAAGCFVTVNPTQKGLIERLGIYTAFVKQGLVFLVPFIDQMRLVNVTQTMDTVEGQKLLTSDSLSLKATMQIYWKVNPDEASVKASQYNVQNYKIMISNLAETTLRAIIGSYTLKDANTKRMKLNNDLAEHMNEQIQAKKNKPDDYWGIEIIRAEIREFILPPDVQHTLDEVVKQENLQKAAEYDAQRKANEAEGDKQVAIKQAEGIKQAQILESEGFKQAEIKRAEGKAKAVELISTAENKYFVKNAQLYKRLETAQIALKDNAKVIVPMDADLVNVVGELAGVPIIRNKKKQ